jgi:hypothetical protein
MSSEKTASGKRVGARLGTQRIPHSVYRERFADGERRYVSLLQALIAVLQTSGERDQAATSPMPSQGLPTAPSDGWHQPRLVDLPAIGTEMELFRRPMPRVLQSCYKSH